MYQIKCCVGKEASVFFIINCNNIIAKMCDLMEGYFKIYFFCCMKTNANLPIVQSATWNQS